MDQISSRLVHIQCPDLPTWSLAGEFQIKRKNTGDWCLKPGDVLFATLITHGMYPLTVIGVSHLSRENQSYPKVVPRTDFGRQKWSYLAKTGPSRTKFGKQNWSGGPLLVAKKGPILPKLVSKFGKQNWSGGPLLAVPWTSLGRYKWSCMLEG